jgi:hypothetical protein
VAPDEGKVIFSIPGSVARTTCVSFMYTFWIIKMTKAECYKKVLTNEGFGSKEAAPMSGLSFG